MHITGNEAQWDVMHAQHGKRKPGVALGADTLGNNQLTGFCH